MKDDDPYADVLQHRLAPEMLKFVPRKIQKRQRHFIMLPLVWFEKLNGATAQTHRVALYLHYLHWKAKGSPIKLPNNIDGVSRRSKWRALVDLERRGLIAVERRNRRSPLIRLFFVKT
jgi:CRP-like cAMP-binding protein